LSRKGRGGNEEAATPANAPFSRSQQKKNRKNEGRKGSGRSRRYVNRGRSATRGEKKTEAKGENRTFMLGADFEKKKKIVGRVKKEEFSSFDSYRNSN